MYDCPFSPSIVWLLAHTHIHTSKEKVLFLWRTEGESCGLGKLDVASELKGWTVSLLQGDQRKKKNSLHLETSCHECKIS